MTLKVLAPLRGTIIDLNKVPDPVFAQEIVGPGVALKPDDHDVVDVVSPVSGTVLKQLNHAVVIRSDAGPAVLVHLGLDSHQLDSGRSTFYCQDGSRVEQGRILLKWDISVLLREGTDTLVPIIIMDPPHPAINVLVTNGERVNSGDTILTLE